MQRRHFLSHLSAIAGASVSLAWSPIHAQVDSEPQHGAVLASTAALFATVESQDGPGFRSLLAPRMEGLAQVRDAVAQLMSSELQIRYQLTETTVTPSSRAFIVRTRWERRFLLPGGTQPQLRGGAATLAFDRVDGSWRLTSLGGDNPFEHGPRR